MQFIERIVVVSPGSTLRRLIRGDFWLSFDTIAAIAKKRFSDLNDLDNRIRNTERLNLKLKSTCTLTSFPRFSPTRPYGARESRRETTGRRENLGTRFMIFFKFSLKKKVDDPHVCVRSMPFHAYSFFQALRTTN